MPSLKKSTFLKILNYFIIITIIFCQPQGKQGVAGFESWSTCPAIQAVHVMALVAEYVPTGHARHVVAPAAEYVPIGQAEQGVAVL